MNNEVFYKPFLDFMQKDVDLDKGLADLIGQHCRPVKFGKGRLLLNAGDICRNIYFITEGEAISYFNSYQGKKITWRFHFNGPGSSARNAPAKDYRSFLTGEPAMVSIETITEVKAIQFSKTDFNYLMKHSVVFESWIRKINERAFSVAYERVFNLLTMSATDRYAKFLKEEAHLLDMFSNYYIASYLGIAPQSLSRIRKNYHRIG
jgi:CRP-like cAMP-binding protein